MSDETSPPDLTDYFAGADSDESRQAIERWIAMDPSRRPFVSEVRQLWELSADGPAADVERLHEGVMAQISSRPDAERSHRAANAKRGLWQQRSKHRSRVAGIAVALAAVIFVLFGAGSWRGQHRLAAESKKYVTSPGQIAHVTLSDGSQVTLGPATTVAVTTGGADGTVAHVTGQALFTVLSSRRAPFVVNAGNTTTRVLGTRFSVRHYPTDRMAQVVVADGRVSLTGRSQNAKNPILSAGMMATCDDSGSVHVAPRIAVDEYMAWTSGTLVFRQTPVREIVAELNRVYDARVVVADSNLSARTFTWKVVVDRVSLADALDALAIALEAHVDRSGGRTAIIPGTAPVSPIRSRSPYSVENFYGR